MRVHAFVTLPKLFIPPQPLTIPNVLTIYNGGQAALQGIEPGVYTLLQL
jgi:hypothetical protein